MGSDKLGRRSRSIVWTWLRICTGRGERYLCRLDTMRQDLARQVKGGPPAGAVTETVELANSVTHRKFARPPHRRMMFMIMAAAASIAGRRAAYLPWADAAGGQTATARRRSWRSWIGKRTALNGSQRFPELRGATRERFREQASLIQAGG